MKISTSIFALVASASFVFANNSVSVNVLNKRELNVSIDNSQLAELNDTCKTQLSTYMDCLESPSNYDYEKKCPPILGDNCQNFYKDPINLIPGCKDDVVLVEKLQQHIKSFVPLYNLGCHTDEVGNRCPFSETSLTTSFLFINGTEFERLTKNTCQSEICRDLTIKAYHKDSAQKLSTFKITIGKEKDKQSSGKSSQVTFTDFLDSSECKYMSGATTLKISSGLLISLGLFLLSFYWNNNKY